jgi:DNA-binding LacI/PurR family transcriptional regulator
MPTIADVARTAGVSISTVSYALSGKRPISANTRAKIDAAIRQLDYHPNAGARALASSRTNVIAVVAPLRAGVNIPMVLEFVSGVVTAAREVDHDVLLVTQEDPAGIARISGRSSADAFVVMDIEIDDPRIPELSAIKQPATLIGIPADPSGLSCVDLDFQAAGRLAIQHLADHGHHNIGFIGSADKRIQRKAGYAVRTNAGLHNGAQANGVVVATAPSEASFAGGQQAVATLLDNHPDTTAIIVHNENALAGVLDGIKRRKLAIPNDISVIAIALRTAFMGLAQNVTAIEVPGFDMGKIAVELAMTRLDNPDSPGETRLLTPKIIDGGTTGAVR